MAVHLGDLLDTNGITALGCKAGSELSEMERAEKATL